MSDYTYARLLMGDDISLGSVCFDFHSTNVLQISNWKYLWSPNDHRQQPVTGPELMSLPIIHLS